MTKIDNILKTNKFIERAKQLHNNKYDYSKVNYITCDTKVKIICPVHGIFEQKPSSHINGRGCAKCRYDSDKLTLEEFKEKAKLKHGNKYDYSLVKYINSSTKVIIICKDHGKFEQTPRGHLSGRGCNKCRYEKLSNCSRSTTEKFIEKANKVHENEYDYSKSIYLGAKSNIKIICPKHGEFEQYPTNHLNGAGCPKCSIEKLSADRKFTKEEFIKRAIKIHGDRYNYSKIDYIDCDNKIKIICYKHGEFEQRPYSHLNGCGCPACGGNKKLSNSEFIEKANKVHANKYDYSKVDYINNGTDIIIICPKHGEFEQTPANHLKGKGCPKCVKNISHKEIFWLNSLNIPDDKLHRQVRINIQKENLNNIIIADGFDPDKNIIYEFYGDRWHGNPNSYNQDEVFYCVNKTYGELYKKTLEREELIKSAGYKLVSIWESDWDNQQKQNKE
jgi:hypothetical protein